jgi:pimeloyl-ACP methyl ester carboxylesterase
MGAATVASAAARRPEMPAFVILEDPLWYASPDEREARNAGWGDWFAWVRAVPGKDPAQALEEYQAQNPAWSDQTLRLRLEAFRQLDPRVLTDLDWDPRPWREMAAAIRCPWLLVIGEPELGGIVTAARAQEAVAQSAAGRWVQIAGAGHNVRYDQPERYLRVLRDFLAAVTPSARQRQRSQPE